MYLSQYMMTFSKSLKNCVILRYLRQLSRNSETFRPYLPLVCFRDIGVANFDRVVQNQEAKKVHPHELVNAAAPSTKEYFSSSTISTDLGTLLGV